MQIAVYYEIVKKLSTIQLANNCFMGNSYSTNELKACISQDLKINVAFPFFATGRNKGSAACCVVDAEWIEKLTRETTTNTTENNNERIILKTPGPPHSVQSGTTSSGTNSNGSGSSNNSSSNGGSQQKQSPTVNIYVNILSKNQDKGDRLSLYQPTVVNKDQESLNGLKSGLFNSWGLNPLILTPESNDQKLEVLTDSFSTFESIFKNLDITHEERYKIFLKRIQQMLWPRCKRFRIENSDDFNDSQLVLIEEPTIDGGNNDDKDNTELHHIDTQISTELANSNLPDVFAIIESDSAYYFLASYRGTTLQDLITYNPGVLSSNLKKSFVVYQILRALASLHSRGVIHGSLKASNILVDENLWAQLGGMECSMDLEDLGVQRLMDEIKSPKLTKAIEEEPLVMQWVRGDISNFSYLMALNHLAGRREGDPNFHPIMPWITDFSGLSIEDGWRDFTKTKFRMNKGEEQLDFTFNGPVPHHITDILSDITYYVYLARRTPISVLCQFVRSKYEPNEYPSSMQRLYNWTPDECIPEFYTDPSIFKSIHKDMPDLQIPQWANSPEEFISKHAAALESEYVSENLHHWIDLTFGNNLTGKGAIEAKNVALPLLAGQNSFMKHGIIQLFKEKHPQRGCNWNKAKESCDISLSRRASEVIEQQQQQRPPSISNEQQSVIYPDRQSSYFTQSLSSQRNLKSTRQSSVPQPTISESPSNTTVPFKERAASIHSTCSSIDTSTSLTSRSTVATEQQQQSNASSIGGTTAPATPAAVAGLTSALRNEPIRFPTEIPDEYFVENLTHYEETIEFAANYQFPNDTIKDLPINPIYPTTTTSATTHHYNIDPFATDSPSPSQFSAGTAYDMYCAGQIIQNIYMAGNSKVMDLDSEPEQSATSGYFEVGNGDVSYDIAPTGRISIPSPVTEVVEILTQDDWQKRPSAKSILCASFPANSVRDPLHSFPFPECILDTYEYLAAFYQAEWTRRLYLADKWIDRICELENEAFMLILPTFTQLFTHNITRVGSISLFPKLAQRLGPEKGKKYLLKPIIFMFETLRPNIPKVLFDQKTINEFVKRLGTGVFLQQMLPCYLESLAINIDSKSSTVEKEELTRPTTTSSSNNITSTTITTTTGTSTESTTTSGSTVPEMAGDALSHICTVLGPILTSKHIVRQLVKIVFRENTVRQIHLHTMGQIAKNFGETFTAIQYQYLISLVDQHFQKATTERNARIICSTMSLLESLMPHMSGQLLATELKSGFVSTLYKLLEPIPDSDDNKKPGTVSEQSIRLRLTLSMRTIDHLVQTAHYLPQKEWETTITSMLQKYFSGFTTNDTSDNHVPQQSDFPEFKAQRNYQMIYAYHQFSATVGEEIIHRSIPTSSSIEKLMYDQFASDNDDNNSTTAPKIDIEKLRQFSTDGLYAFSGPVIHNSNGRTKDVDPSLSNTENQRKQTNNGVTQKASDKESKSKVPSSVLPWKTKWRPSPEDRKNWNRFLSTNSEEMSKSMQFSFNDLKLRGFAGHTATVRTIAVNEPAKLFASGSRDRTVKLWSLNVHDGIENWETTPYSECVVTYTGHRRGTINDVHFLTGIGSGLSDVVASCDGHVHLWNLETGKNIHQFTSSRPSVITVKPIFHNQNLVGGTLEGNLTFFDTHNHRLLHTWKSNANLTGSIRVIAVNQAETLIAVSFSTGAISLVESRTGTLVASWKGGDTEITMMKFYTDELLVSCAPADHLICCWNVNHLALVKTMTATQDVISLDLFKDEILTINNSNSVSFIPVNDELQSYSSKFKSSIIKSQVSAFAIVPTEPSLLFGCTEGEIFLYA